MATATDQEKRSVHVSILLVLVVGLVAPTYAGTRRDDFDDLPPLKILNFPQLNETQIGDWKLHRECLGVGRQGPWFIRVEDSFVKVKDGGCNLGGGTGIYQLESWTDYEVKTRIRVNGFQGPGIVILIRAQRCVPEGVPEGGRFVCWGGPPRHGFQQKPVYRIWRDNPLKRGQWYDVRIVAEGHRITYFLDGRKVNEETTDRMSGGVAFIAELSEFWLDYIEITEILSVQPQGKLVTYWAMLKHPNKPLQ